MAQTTFSASLKCTTPCIICANWLFNLAPSPHGCTVIEYVCDLLCHCRVLNRETFGQVVLQLCSSMLLSNVCILVGFHKKGVDDDIVCLVIAVLSHYFTLATLLWVSVTSQHVYKLLGNEVAAKERCFILKRSLIAWGKCLRCM